MGEKISPTVAAPALLARAESTLRLESEAIAALIPRLDADFFRSFDRLFQLLQFLDDDDDETAPREACGLRGSDDDSEARAGGPSEDPDPEAMVPVNEPNDLTPS